MWFRFFIFLPVTTLVWLSLHFLVYRSAVFFLKIPEAAQSYALVFFMFMAVSFLMASVLGHWFFNFFTRLYYRVSVIWMGFFAHLFLVTVLGWLFIFAAGKLGMVVDRKTLGGTVFLLAGIFSVYGIWKAYHYRIVNISADLKNLPSHWIGKNVVQIADIHLGHVHGAKFMEKIAADVNKLQPEAIFITGDLFDGMDGKFEDYIEAIDSLRAPQGIYFINGNHEVYLGLRRIIPLLEKIRINIVDDRIVELNGIQLIGVNYPDFSEKIDFQKILSNHQYDKMKPSILLTHVPSYIQVASRNEIDLHLAGHTHLGQIFPNSFLTRFVFGKFHYGFHVIGNYQIYTTSGVGTWGPPMRTASTPEIVNITLH